MSIRTGFALAAGASFLIATAQAQAPAPQPTASAGPPPQYGVSLDPPTAKKAAAAAIAEASKIGSAPDAVAIVNTGGYLVYFERMDNTQIGSVQVAIDKARAAVLYRRPTKVFEDIVAGGGAGLRILAIHDAIPIDGGVPLIIGGKVVGAIGASGGTAQQDGQVAQAGASALK